MTYTNACIRHFEESHGSDSEEGSGRVEFAIENYHSYVVIIDGFVGSSLDSPAAPTSASYACFLISRRSYAQDLVGDTIAKTR